MIAVLVVLGIFVVVLLGVRGLPVRRPDPLREIAHAKAVVALDADLGLVTTHAMRTMRPQDWASRCRIICNLPVPPVQMLVLPQFGWLARTCRPLGNNCAARTMTEADVVCPIESWTVTSVLVSVATELASKAMVSLATF